MDRPPDPENPVHPHRIRDEINRLPVDPDVELAAAVPHPFTLVRRDADLLPVIAAGGALGSLARWGLAEILPHIGFAWSTVAANVIGSVLLGVVMALVLDVWSHTRYLRPFLGVGVLGGFTTFSTFELDTHALLADGRLPLAAVYVAVTLVAGLVGVLTGLAATRALIDRRRTEEAAA